MIIMSTHLLHLACSSLLQLKSKKEMMMSIVMTILLPPCPCASPLEKGSADMRAPYLLTLG